MSVSFITLKTKENFSQDLIIQKPPSGISLQGLIEIPGDKSISHRALILGSIADGETEIQGLLLGEDPYSTAACFQAMGAKISELNTISVRIKGIGLGNLQEPLDVLNAGNSGTTLRLILGLLASHSDKFFTVTGDTSLRARPMSRVIQPLQQMGAEIWGRRNNSLAPLAVYGKSLRSICYNSQIASAQVKSCILLAGLMTEGKTIVTEPSLSRDHSERMLKAFGAELAIDPEARSVTINGGTKLYGQKVIVPGDISSAAFWLVAGSILPGSDIIIKNVGVNPTRTGVLEALKMMGANIIRENEREVGGEAITDLRVFHSHLKGCIIAGDIIPRLIDEIPVLAVAAVYAKGKTVIRDAYELRVKESDRIMVMVKQLQQMGAKITELDDGMEITGGMPLRGADLDSHTDHRITMSLAVAALNAKGKTTIRRAEATNISYPGFASTLRQVCIQ